ncbi:tetratricopeptide repeat protein [Lutibacter holmesii]|uniref:Tetratricopeptide repeat protein n=1 Tax=Lutibacter holmesii TaxID=1137985 RepID=A0ABW3WMQ2_9FLAO
MNYRIKLALFFFSAITFYVNAQDCESIREKAMQLESAISPDNPKTYYDYAAFIGSQVAKGNTCMNKDIRNSLFNLFVKGANNGSIRCAARLVMTSYYGLYDYPTDRYLSFENSLFNIKLAYDTFLSDLSLYNEFGYVIPTIYLHNYLRNEKWRKDFGSSPELAKAALGLLQLAVVPEVKDDDKNSFKYIKNDYNKIWCFLYLEGQLETPIDYSKGLSFAKKVDRTYLNSWVRKILKENEYNSDFLNPAGLAFIGAVQAKGWYNVSSIDPYSNTIYQANISKVATKVSFQESYKMMSPSLKEIIDTAYPSYSTIDEKWEVINNSKLKEPESYPQWKYLPDSERENLYLEALEGEDSSLSEKQQFQVYKAMVSFNDNRGLLPLAYCYKLGKGVFPSGNKAIHTFEKALSFPSLKEEAAYSIAQIYDGSLKDIDVDWVKAAKYYKMSTNYNPKAYTMLGEMAYFGVGGFTKNTSLATDYFEKGKINGDNEAFVRLETVNYIPEFETELEAEYENFTLSITNFDDFNSRKLYNSNSLTIEVDYNVPQGFGKNTLRIFPTKDKAYAIPYSTWSPSNLLEGTGQEKVIIYNNNFKKGSRQFGVFYILSRNHNGNVYTVYHIPIAVCFMPQK